MSSRFLGVNVNILPRTLTKFNNAFNDFEDALIRVTQEQFVDAMEDLWCCEEAVQYFRKTFKPTIDNLNTNALNVFRNTFNVVSNAGNTWIKQTQTTNVLRKVNFSVRKKIINVAKIKRLKSDGSVGIDKAAAIAKSSLLLSSTHVKCVAALAKLKSAVRNCGLLGGQQEAQLNASISKLESSLSQSIENLAKQIKKLIETTADRYDQTASGISSNIGSSIISGVGSVIGELVNLVPQFGASESSCEGSGVVTKYAPPSMISGFSGEGSGVVTKYAPPSMISGFSGEGSGVVTKYAPPSMISGFSGEGSGVVTKYAPPSMISDSSK